MANPPPKKKQPPMMKVNAISQIKEQSREGSDYDSESQQEYE